MAINLPKFSWRIRSVTHVAMGVGVTGAATNRDAVERSRFKGLGLDSAGLDGALHLRVAWLIVRNSSKPCFSSGKFGNPLDSNRSPTFAQAPSVAASTPPAAAPGTGNKTDDDELEIMNQAKLAGMYATYANKLGALPPSMKKIVG